MKIMNGDRNMNLRLALKQNHARFNLTRFHLLRFRSEIMKMALPVLIAMSFLLPFPAAAMKMSMAGLKEC